MAVKRFGAVFGAVAEVAVTGEDEEFVVANGHDLGLGGGAGVLFFAGLGGVSVFWSLTGLGEVEW